MQLDTLNTTTECHHDWLLSLNLEVPSLVLVYCTICGFTIDHIWPGASALIYMEMPDFTVADGRHTAARDVQMPIDVRIKQSMSFSRQAGMGSTLEIFVTPKTLGIEANPITPGWCAPSP